MILERLVGYDPTTFSLATRRATTAPQPHEFGAVNGGRTRGLNLGKVVLCQLSYYRMSLEHPEGVEPS